LLAAYSEKVAPLQSLRPEEGVLCALNRNGILVVPVSFDYAIWTENVAQRADALAGLVKTDQNTKSAELWTDGKLSDRLKAELDRRSILYESLSARPSERHGAHVSRILIWADAFGINNLDPDFSA